MDLNHRGPVGRRIYSPVQSTAMRYLQKAVGILLRHALDVSAWWSEPRFKQLSKTSYRTLVSFKGEHGCNPPMKTWKSYGESNPASQDENLMS